MLDVLRDLYDHQAWADAEHWRVLGSTVGALNDAAIGARLHHIHLVQHAFLALARGDQPARTRPDDFAEAGDLKRYAREAHRLAADYLGQASADDLRRRIAVPWFQDPPLEVSIGDGLMQAAMHSHYHRGQNAARLRELGGVPPLTDLIVWQWKGRPAPRWE